MQELAMNVLDIAQNSVAAGAGKMAVRLEIDEVGSQLTISIEDDGCGMTPEVAARVTDPFYTTRTTRSVGLGVPFFKMAAEMTGGRFDIRTAPGEGTTVTAVFVMSHIDLMPLGDMDATMCQLMCLNEGIDITYSLRRADNEFSVSTGEFQAFLEGLPMNTPQVMLFVQDYLRDNTKEMLTFDSPNYFG